MRGSVYGMQTTSTVRNSSVSTPAKRIAEQRAAAKLQEHRSKRTPCKTPPSSSKNAQAECIVAAASVSRQQRQLKSFLRRITAQEEASAEEQAMLARQRKLDADVKVIIGSVGV